MVTLYFTVSLLHLLHVVTLVTINYATCKYKNYQNSSDKGRCQLNLNRICIAILFERQILLKKTDQFNQLSHSQSSFNSQSSFSLISRAYSVHAVRIFNVFVLRQDRILLPFKLKVMSMVTCLVINSALTITKTTPRLLLRHRLIQNTEDIYFLTSQQVSLDCFITCSKLNSFAPQDVTPAPSDCCEVLNGWRN